MDEVAALPSRAIYQILMPTFRIFTPLLQAKSAAIQAISKTTHSYGPHPRHQVDIYTPPTASASQRAPILIFLYGGGLNGGDRILPAAAIPDSLVYANLGAFFASRGLVTVIPDYRRVNDPKAGTGEDAVYPSGAVDLAAVLDWLADGGSSRGSALDGDSDGSSRDVFIMGNSAGGVHLATWLLAPQFEAARRSYLSGSGAIRLSGAVLFAVPFHFKDAGPGPGDVLPAYYGAAVEQKCPFGLLEAIKATEGLKQAELGLPLVLNLEGELDPEEGILRPGRDFVRLWRQKFGVEGIEEWVLSGHNHISPPVALMTGDREGERWGEDLVEWMTTAMKR